MSMSTQSEQLESVDQAIAKILRHVGEKKRQPAKISSQLDSVDLEEPEIDLRIKKSLDRLGQSMAARKNRLNVKQ
ncbi:hypothetical protein CCP3SC15_550025 [Gammaproteobacteria bacterium]